MTSFADNQRLADRLREKADLLERQEASRYRVAAYRRAAETLMALGEDVAVLAAREGMAGLTALPGIGPSIGAAIMEMLKSGRWSQLERLRGELEPERLFRTIPGVGPKLAHELHQGLHVDTLAALDAAANDGRVEALAGVGARRAAMLRANLASMLARRRPVLRAGAPDAEPDVATLLDVDTEYRERARAGRRPKITPKRFNPTGESWLPVLHAHRGDWQFTVLFSNTARAHEFGRTRDWVVLYFQRDDRPEGQRTVVTESRGALAGRRVVRGREAECRAHCDRGTPRRAPNQNGPDPVPIRGQVSDCAATAGALCSRPWPGLCASSSRARSITSPRAATGASRSTRTTRTAGATSTSWQASSSASVGSATPTA